MTRQPETLFKVKVQADLNKLIRRGAPIWFYKSQEVGRRGIPDIIMSINGTFVALELKTDVGRPTPLQLHTLTKIGASNGWGIVTSPKVWPDTLAWITGLVKEFV